MNRAELTDWLTTHLADMLAIRPEEVDPDLPMDALGVDSAATLVLAGDLSGVLGREIEPFDILDHKTVHDLADYLSGLPVEV